jgi:hypothetical protein
VVGGIYSPNHQKNRWWRLLSHGAPDSPVRHQTLSGAPATSPGCWVLTVGASDSWATGHALFTVWCAFWLCSDFCAHCSALTARCRRPLGLCSRYSAGAPYSPVLHRTVRRIIAERLPEFLKVASSDWNPLVHRTVRCARPGHTSVVFCSLYLNPFLVFLLVCCEPLAPIKLII